MMMPASFLSRYVVIFSFSLSLLAPVFPKSMIHALRIMRGAARHGGAGRGGAGRGEARRGEARRGVAKRRDATRGDVGISARY